MYYSTQLFGYSTLATISIPSPTGALFFIARGFRGMDSFFKVAALSLSSYFIGRKLVLLFTKPYKSQMSFFPVFDQRYCFIICSQRPTKRPDQFSMIIQSDLMEILDFISEVVWGQRKNWFREIIQEPPDAAQCILRRRIRPKISMMMNALKDLKYRLHSIFQSTCCIFQTQPRKNCYVSFGPMVMSARAISNAVRRHRYFSFVPKKIVLPLKCNFLTFWFSCCRFLCWRLLLVARRAAENCKNLCNNSSRCAVVQLLSCGWETNVSSSSAASAKTTQIINFPNVEIFFQTFQQYVLFSTMLQ